MKLMLCILFALVAVSTARFLCRDIAPKNDVNWSKLNGTWYHLLFFSKFEPICRKMVISNVDSDLNMVNVKFHNTRSYSQTPWDQSRDFSFKWEENPGVIFAEVKNTWSFSDTGYKGSKISPKFNPIKKSGASAYSDVISARYIVIATDYDRYLVFIQCGGAAPGIGVSLKESSVDNELHEEIKGKVVAAGFDASHMNFKGTIPCSQ